VQLENKKSGETRSFCLSRLFRKRKTDQGGCVCSVPWPVFARQCRHGPSASNSTQWRGENKAIPSS